MSAWLAWLSIKSLLDFWNQAKKSKAAAWTQGMRGSPLQYAAQPSSTYARTDVWTYIKESIDRIRMGISICVCMRIRPPLDYLLIRFAFTIQSEAVWDFTTNCMTLSKHKWHDPSLSLLLISFQRRLSKVFKNFKIFQIDCCIVWIPFDRNQA